jgi:RNA polymerase sigma-54 factor
MALTPRLEVRQRQALVMTPQMLQSVKLLQMSNLDLADFVAEQVERNPLLEFRPRAAAPPSVASSGVRSGTQGSGAPDLMQTIAAEVTLWQHLHAQIGAMRLSPDRAEAALLVADELEDDGYLRVPLDEVASRHRLSVAEVAAALATVQSCDPAGVGARSLGECLALQLRDRDRLDPAMQSLLANLPLVAAGRRVELQARCGVDAEDLADMLAELRALDPRPGDRFATAAVQVAVPDVYVTRTRSGGLTVELNGETLPRVLVSNIYAAGISANTAETRAFISECRASAGWLVRSLEQRARTILKVATEMVRHQERFFEHGVGQLRPLTRRMVAERVKLHESTVSRVTAGKYLACDQGVFELRHFFSAALQSLSGGEDLSAAAVQDRIRQVIGAEEGSRTLSDDRIVAILNAEGIDIARRTVAKYREGMGIPSSVERRRGRIATRGG